MLSRKTHSAVIAEIVVIGQIVRLCLIVDGNGTTNIGCVFNLVG